VGNLNAIIYEQCLVYVTAVEI